MLQPPLRANVANTQASIMQRLLLSAQAGINASTSAAARSDRTRDEFVFPNRASIPTTNRPFHPQTAQQQQQPTSDLFDLWSNGDPFNFGLNGFGIGSTMFPHMANPPQLSVVYLRCPECGIGKTSSEEMEVHMKMEHLQWLPFQCPICSAERASDLQMREHIHSAHRKNSNKFIYVDNPGAKRLLQILMDRSLSTARRPNTNGVVSQIANNFVANNGLMNGATMSNRERNNNLNGTDEARIHEGVISGTSSPPTEPRGDSPLRNLAALSNGHDHQTPPLQAPSATATVVSRKRPSSRGIESTLTGNSSTDALLSAIRAATHEATEEHSLGESSPMEEVYDDDEDHAEIGDPMSQIFAARKRARNELNSRDDNAQQCDEMMLGCGGTTEEPQHDPADILGNVAAMFNVEDLDLNGLRRRSANGIYSSARSKANSSSISKKRVLGECSKCKKPVTAGARQMHMFYHLGKDCNIYRFRCKYPNCDVEHYRKDQMENHHSKQHGKIDPTLMEDRTAELFNSCQELSMQLLGTTGNTPGPTAAKAQLAYNATMAAQALNQHRKKKKHLNLEMPPIMVAPINTPPPVPSHSPVSSPTFQPKLTTSTSAVIDAVSKTSAEPPEEQTLECRLCHKVMYNRIRGFHILWHMAKDLGINRYVCKFCDFGHDRSQSVQTHGKREHGVEDSVEDRIEEYSDEVKSMSEACFGFQAIFSQDTRRRGKPPSLSRSGTPEDGNEGSEGSLPVEHEGDGHGAEEVIEDRSNEASTTFQNGNIEQPETNKNETLRMESVKQEDDCHLEATLTPKCENAETEPSSTSALEIKSITPKCEARCSSLPPLSSSSTSTSSYRSRKAKNRRFGVRKQPSRLKRKEMARLREMSMKLGGAQYFKKRVNEAALCEKCGVLTTSRMSDHAYRHMDVQLFLCPHCDIGNPSRELVVRHIRDMHDSTQHPIDDRLKYAAEIKEMIRQCYPAYFIDAPIPTAADIENIKAGLKRNALKKKVHEETQEDRSNEPGVDDGEHDTEESGDEHDAAGDESNDAAGDESFDATGDGSILHDEEETGQEETEDEGVLKDDTDGEQTAEDDNKGATASIKITIKSKMDREEDEEVEAEM